MLILITYDVNVTESGGAKRLRQIAKICLDFGVRVQNSVFECEVSPAELVQLKNMLLSIYCQKLDSVRFYHLGKKGRNKVEHYGSKKIADPLNDTLIL